MKTLIQKKRLMRRKSLFLLSFYVFAQITSLLILVLSLDVFVCFTCCPWSYLRYTPSCTIQFVIECFIMHSITILFERRSCVIANPMLKKITEYLLKTAVFILATSASANLVVKIYCGCNDLYYDHGTCL